MRLDVDDLRTEVGQVFPNRRSGGVSAELDHPQAL